MSLDTPRKRLEVNPDIVKKFHTILKEYGFHPAKMRSFLSIDEASFLKGCFTQADDSLIEGSEMDWDTIYSLVAEKFNLFSGGDIADSDIENSDSARIVSLVRAIIPTIPKKKPSSVQEQPSSISQTLL